MKAIILVIGVFLSFAVAAQDTTIKAKPENRFEQAAKEAREKTNKAVQVPQKKVSPDEKLLSINDAQEIITSLKDKLLVTDWEKVLNAIDAVLGRKIKEVASAKASQ